eukprot:12666032-Alexandrium_andersonii.AAC.1
MFASWVHSFGLVPRGPRKDLVEGPGPNSPESRSVSGVKVGSELRVGVSEEPIGSALKPVPPLGFGAPLRHSVWRWLGEAP